MSNVDLQQQPQGADQSAGWQDFYNDRVQRRDAATDDATRALFDAELQQARITMQFMGITPEAGTGGEESPSDAPPSGFDPAPAYDDSFEYNAGSDTPSDPPIVQRGSTGSDGSGSAGSSELGILPAALEPYRDEILAASEATGVDPLLITAVIWDESKGNPKAGTVNGENGLTDSGLMQVNPGTYTSLQSQNMNLLHGDLSDPAEQIMAGTLYLKQNIEQFKDIPLALRGYNSGPGAVDPSDPAISLTGKGTKNYVEKIEYFLDILRNGGELPASGYPGGNEYY
jgi:hypothetical protein